MVRCCRKCDSALLQHGLGQLEMARRVRLVVLRGVVTTPKACAAVPRPLAAACSHGSHRSVEGMVPGESCQKREEGESGLYVRLGQPRHVVLAGPARSRRGVRPRCWG